MNCKPGDLAVGVNAVPAKRCNIGSLVRVIRAHEILPNYWVVEALNSFFANGRNWPAGSIARAADADLRPIRPDETPEESLEAMRLLTQISKEEKV